MFEVFSVFQLWPPFCAVEQNVLSNFGRGPPKELSYPDWLKSARGLWRRCCLQLFISVALATILCTEVEQYCAIFVGNFPRNNPIKFGCNPPSGYGGDVI